jgi:hypothetical protein
LSVSSTTTIVDSSAAHEGGAADVSEASLVREFQIEQNKLKFRNTKILLNALCVVLNGVFLMGYIALTHYDGMRHRGLFQARCGIVLWHCHCGRQLPALDDWC